MYSGSNFQANLESVLLQNSKLLNEYSRLIGSDQERFLVVTDINDPIIYYNDRILYRWLEAAALGRAYSALGSALMVRAEHPCKIRFAPDPYGK